MSDRSPTQNDVAATPPGAAATSCRFCLGCGYALTATAGSPCPECGRAFDPTNPRTTAASPRGHRLRMGLRRTTLVLLSGLAAAGLLGVAWGFTGGDPLVTVVFGLPLLIPAIALVALVSIRSNPIGWRTRLAGLAAAALLISVVLPGLEGHDWPLRASIRLHHAGLNRIASEVSSLDDDALEGRTARTGLLRIRRIARWKGNLGLQLSGDAGGGVFLVRPSADWTPSACTLWMNTNWTIDLGDGWWLVEQD